jgi:hypothetical protein
LMLWTGAPGDRRKVDGDRLRAERPNVYFEPEPPEQPGRLRQQPDHRINGTAFIGRVHFVALTRARAARFRSAPMDAPSSPTPHSIFLRVKVVSKRKEQKLKHRPACGRKEGQRIAQWIGSHVLNFRVRGTGCVKIRHARFPHAFCHRFSTNTVLAESFVFENFNSALADSLLSRHSPYVDGPLLARCFAVL